MNATAEYLDIPLFIKMRKDNIQRLYRRVRRVASKSATGKAVLLRSGPDFHVLPSCSPRINALEDEGFEVVDEFTEPVTAADFMTALNRSAL